MLKTLKKGRKILGMNSRNLEYIRPLNLKKAKRLADDKILSKKILKKGEIPVPKLIAKISSYKSLENFNWDILPPAFALKPNRGFGGEGIIVVYGKKKPARNVLPSDGDKGEGNIWIKADGSKVSVQDLKNHISNIIEGSFSLSGISDTAFFEERLKLLKLFKPYSNKGIPDIRVLVYNKVPIMAMLRIPTKTSGGKANLQQGALGVGIDLATGTTTTAIHKKNRIIEYAPGTRLLLSGIKIPNWQEILKLAVKAQEISGVGFLGADIALDRERGPVFLELNARPGLSIQIANMAGLKERLERVQGLNIKTMKRGIQVGMNLFGGDVEEGLEDISGKKVIGTVEKVKLVGKNGKEAEVEAKIDTGAGFSSIDTELAKQLGFEAVVLEYEKLNINYEEIKKLSKDQREVLFKNIPDLADTAIIHSATGTTYRPMIKISIIIDKVSIPAKVSIINRSNLKNPIIIGRKNLGNFLVDISKK